MGNLRLPLQQSTAWLLSKDKNAVRFHGISKSSINDEGGVHQLVHLNPLKIYISHQNCEKGLF